LTRYEPKELYATGTLWSSIETLGQFVDQGVKVVDQGVKDAAYCYTNPIACLAVSAPVVVREGYQFAKDLIAVDEINQVSKVSSCVKPEAQAEIARNTVGYLAVTGALLFMPWSKALKPAGRLMSIAKHRKHGESVAKVSGLRAGHAILNRAGYSLQAKSPGGWNWLTSLAANTAAPSGKKIALWTLGGTTLVAAVTGCTRSNTAINGQAFIDFNMAQGPGGLNLCLKGIDFEDPCRLAARIIACLAIAAGAAAPAFLPN
jgi:hypothetical protein